MFEQSCDLVKKLKRRPSDDELLSLYGLFKQATVGNVNTGQPWLVDYENRKKWDSWKANEGKTSEQAKTEYVKTYLQLARVYN